MIEIDESEVVEEMPEELANLEPEIDLSELDKYNDEFNATDETSVKDVPAGTYQVFIQKSEFRRAKESENLYLNWEYVIMEGEFKESYLWSSSSFHNPKSMGFFKGHMSAIGCPLPQPFRLSSLKDVLPGCENRVLKVKVTITKKNMQENKRLTIIKLVGVLDQESGMISEL